MKRLLILVVIAGLAIAYIYHDEQQKRMARQQASQQVVAVTVSPVLQKTVTLQLLAIGTVQPYATVTVKSQVDGQLLQTGFTPGQMVHKGQVLFVIDPQPFVVALKKAQAELAHDEAQLTNTRLSRERYAKLLKKAYVSQQDYDQLRANELSAIALVQADRAAIATAQLSLDYCTIKSPLEGRAGDRLVHPGNLIKTASNTPLVTINQISPIYVAFAVPEQNLAQIQQPSNAPIPVQARVNEKLVERGILTFIDNAIDATTGNIALKATFTNAAQRLWPGRFVRITLPVTTFKEAIVVPARAVQEGQDGPYVFVIQPDATVRQQAVKVGPTVAEGTLIHAGLRAGEQVVTAGQLQLTAGAKVSVKP